MMPRRLRKTSAKSVPLLLFAWLVAAAAGVAAAWLAGVANRPQPELYGRDFIINPQAYPTVTAKGVSLPFLFGDFDLYLNAQLPVDTTFDIVFRKVAPVITRDGGGEFHARFSLLRLHSETRGPAYRTREEALFGEIAGGVKVAYNVPVTVIVQGRGRRVRANVGGEWLPWTETVDDHGHIELVARGGEVPLTLLKVHAVARLRDLPAWLWAGALALLAGIIASMTRTPPLVRALIFAIALPLGGWLGGQAVVAHLMPWAQPSTLGALAAALVGLAPALAACARRRWLWLGLAVLAAVAQLEFAARCERPRLEPLQDPRLSLYFGDMSGTAPFDALTTRVPNRTEVFNMGDRPRNPVMFLGGRALFDARADFAESVGLLTALAVRSRLGIDDVSGVVLPTAFSNTLQQLLLFRRFYRAFEPRVVVFGLTRFEASASERVRPRALFEAYSQDGPGVETSALTLLELRRRTAAGTEPTATPDDLLATLRELRTLKRAMKFRVVLVTEPGVDPALLAVFEKFGAKHSWPVVKNVIASDGAPKIDALVEAIVGVW